MNETESETDHEPTTITWDDVSGVWRRFAEKFEPDPDTRCWEWTAAKNPDWGYGRLNVEGRTRHAHRVSFLYAFGEIPAGYQVNHSCHNPSCVNPVHLYTGTQQDNIDDAMTEGDMLESRPRGEDNGMAELTWDDVEEIRRLYDAGGHTHRSLAAKFDVAKNTISAILREETWKPENNPNHE